jgi:hypothetical protein
MSTYYETDEFKKSVQNIVNQLNAMVGALYPQGMNKLSFIRFWKMSRLKKYLRLGPEVSITEDLIKVGLVSYDMINEGSTFEESFFKYFLDDESIQSMVFVSNNSVEEEECPYCNDDGMVDCESCNGLGSQQCHDCEGDGEIECSYCDGDPDSVDGGCGNCDESGKVECNDCDGRGEIDCYDCDAAQETTCNECGGDHITGVYAEFEYDIYISTDPNINIVLDKSDNLAYVMSYCDDNNIDFTYVSGDMVSMDFKHYYGWDIDDLKQEIINLPLALEDNSDDEKILFTTLYGIIEPEEAVKAIKNRFH